jgi:hypothetical protein
MSSIDLSAEAGDSYTASDFAAAAPPTRHLASTSGANRSSQRSAYS